MTIQIPEWMKIRDVYEVGGSFRQLSPKRKRDNQFILNIDRLDFTRQFVFTTNPNDYTHDQDGDGISDIEEVSIYRTHPAIADEPSRFIGDAKR